MESKKKLIIVLVVMCSVLLMAVAGIVVVLVASASNTTSTVKVEFVADRVECLITANYTVGDVTTDIKKGTSTTLYMTSNKKQDAFDKTSTISLSVANPKVVFMYRIDNLHTTVDAIVDINSYPTYSNVSVNYAYANSVDTDVDDLELNSSFDKFVLGSNTYKCVYIIVEVKDLTADANYAGTLQFDLSRAEASEVLTVNFDKTTFSDAINVNQFNPYKVLVNSKFYEPDIFPIINDKMFYQWKYNVTNTSGGSVVSNRTTFPYTIATPGTITLSAEFKNTDHSGWDMQYTSMGDGTCVFTTFGSGLATDLVIPDMHNNEYVTALRKLEGVTLNGTLYVNNMITEIPKDYTSGITFNNPNIWFGRSVRIINENAFPSEYIRLYNVKLPDSVRVIKENAFYWDFLSGYVDPAGYTTCYAYAYNNNDAYILTRWGTEHASVEAFSGNDNIIAFYPSSLIYYQGTTFNIPSKVVALPKLFNTDCVVTSLSIPSNIEYISEGIIPNATMSNISISTANKYYDNRNGCNAIIETKTNTLIQASSSTTAIPDSIERIGENAFKLCTSLTSIKLPLGLKHIDNGAFSSCSSLTSIQFPSTIQTINGTPFSGNSLSSTALNYGDNAGTFVPCWNDPSKYVCLSIASGKTQSDIDKWDSIVCFASNACASYSGQFNCPQSLNGISDSLLGSAITGVALNDTLRYIGKDFLINCANVSGVVIPASVKYLSGLIIDGIIRRYEFSGTSSNWKAYHGNFENDYTIMTTSEVSSYLSGSGSEFPLFYTMFERQY